MVQFLGSIITGVLALWAAKKGARSVVALDIDPESVKRARDNSQKFNVTDTVTVVQSDGYESLPKGAVFDTILFFAPVPTRDKTASDTRRYDPTYDVLKKFLDGAPNHLAPGGKVKLMYPDNPSSLRQLAVLAKKAGLAITERVKLSNDEALLAECRSFHLKHHKLNQAPRFSAEDCREALADENLWTWSVFTLQTHP